MTIRKVKGLESDFTIVPNQTINDKLSWAARGMLLYLCSKPDDWEVNITDLVNQTTGSAKRSGRDAVRKIMDELVDCGYMRKTQNRIAGKFDNNDHEVSFVPFTENPYTANPSTANPTQQSKDYTKEGNNKGLNNEHFSKEKRIDVFSLDSVEFAFCQSAQRFMVYMDATLKSDPSGSNVYTGGLTIGQWEDCESKLREILDDPEQCSNVIYNIYQDRRMGNKKTVSLPYILMDFANVDEFSHIALNCTNWTE